MRSISKRKGCFNVQVVLFPQTKRKKRVYKRKNGATGDRSGVESPQYGQNSQALTIYLLKRVYREQAKQKYVLLHRQMNQLHGMEYCKVIVRTHKERHK